jgi:hypothetical protein
MGKLRESLTVSAEVYKKHILRYLFARGYYLKADSDVEASFADAILTRKEETRDYWLEAKETTVSLGESSFVSQLAKYLAEYLSMTPEKRFKMMLACYRLVNAPLFERVYNKLESEALNSVIEKMIESSATDIKAILTKASVKDVKQFFEEMIVIEAELKDLEIAQEKIKPTPPTMPNLSEADYAAKIMTEFGEILPVKETDEIFLNIFELDVPSTINVAKTVYRTTNDIFVEKPNTSFPAFDLDGGKIRSFNEFTKENPLHSFILPDSVTSVNLKEFIENENNESTVIKILNRWIRNKCRKMGLMFDKRTYAYYYPRNANGEGLVTAKWKAPTKESCRELTKPMKDEEKINFWVHRSASISAKKFWGKYYVQIKPRFLFSPDGFNLFEGLKADKLDRKYRKSKYSHNLNQFYDVLFWYRHVFPETENLGTADLNVCLGFKSKPVIRVLEQIKIKSEYKPNIEGAENLEELEEIEPDTSNLQTLDQYFGD